MASKHCKPGKGKKSGKANNHAPDTIDSTASTANTGESSEVEADPDMFDGVHRSILEAFDNLNWEDNFSYEEQKELNKYWIPPDAESVSYTMKLIDNAMVTFLTKEIKLPPWSGENGDKQSQSFYMPGLKPNHVTMLPKHSVLTFKEQSQLYTFYCYMNSRNKRPMTEEQLATFQELRTKVAEEYAEFQEFAKSEWYKGQWRRVLEVPPAVEQYIDCLWKMRAGQCLSVYPDEYRSIDHIPLTLNDANQDFSVFKFIKHLHTSSMPLKVSLPRTKQPLKLISDFEDLSRLKPVSSDFQTRPRPFMKSISQVSLDLVVDNLLKLNDLDVDVVISMSGIKTLIDNIKFRREWVLPIVVKEVLKNDGETVKRVVIIDKNLPQKCLSVHEKNIWHAKVVAKWMLVQSDFPSLLEKEDKPSPRRSSESYEDMLSEVVEKLNVDKATGNEVTNETKSKSPEQKFKSSERNFKTPEPRFKSPERKFKRSEEKFNSSEEKFKSSEPKFESSKPIFKSPLPPPPPAQSCKFKASGFKPSTSVLPPNNFESRKRGRQTLSYDDDPFSDSLVHDFEEFGVDKGPTKHVRITFTDKKETTSPPHHPKACRKIPEESSTAKTIKISKNEVCSRPLEKNSRNKEDQETSFERKLINPSAGSIEDNSMNENLGNPNANSERKWIKPSATKRELVRPCLQYDLWNIQKSKYIQFLKGEQRSLNVLVRTRRDGRLFHYQNNAATVDDVCVSSKLEFQPEYGAAKMAASELTREFLDLHMRPNAKLVRVRSIGHTKEVMMTEVKTLTDVKNALQQEVREIHRLFDPLYAVLTKLIDLPAGRYMLQHQAKQGPFATLMIEAPGCASFNLPYYCQEMKRVEVNVPPMPIDPLVLTPLQHRDRLAPALFLPKHNEQSIFFSKPRVPLTNKKKNKGKRKNKGERKKNKNEPQPADDENYLDSNDLLSNSLGIAKLWPSV